MTEELTYDTIPNEFWPKCAWCGEDLGGCTFEVESDWGKQRICVKCQDTLGEQVRSCIPWLLRDLADFLNEKDKHRKGVSLLGHEDMLKEAIQNMKEAHVAREES